MKSKFSYISLFEYLECTNLTFLFVIRKMVCLSVINVGSKNIIYIITLFHYRIHCCYILCIDKTSLKVSLASTLSIATERMTLN